MTQKIRYMDRFRTSDQSLRLSLLHKDIFFKTVKGAYEFVHLFLVINKKASVIL